MFSPQKESGQYRRMETRWAPALEDCAAQDITISFDNIVSAFAAVAAGAGVAAAAAVAEQVIPKKTKKTRRVAKASPVPPPPAKKESQEKMFVKRRVVLDSLPPALKVARY